MGDKIITNCQDVQDACWSECFPLGQDNSSATLLTMDPSPGYARYNLQGIACYDEGKLSGLQRARLGNLRAS
jgi:hypothetical protein